MWVFLNGKGIDKYRDIFPDGKVPFRNLDFFKATLGENHDCLCCSCLLGALDV